MNTVIEALLENVRKDPTPEGHTSSYWQEYARRIQIQEKGNDVSLSSTAFETVHKQSFPSRVLHALERLSYAGFTSRLKSYPNVWACAYQLARDLGGDPNYNVFKAAAIVSVLSDHWQEHQLTPRTFAIIGDGFGFLGALLRRTVPNMRLYSIDLPKSLLFQARTHLMADPQSPQALLGKNAIGRSTASITFVPAPEAETVPDAIDCGINIASMQEMNSFSIRYYFDFFRKRSKAKSRFYCVNRRRKELPGGEVAVFTEYPWQKQDQIFIDGLCPYYRYYLGSQTTFLGPRFLGFRVPFVNHFEGDHWHRLVHLEPLS